MCVPPYILGELVRCSCWRAASLWDAGSFSEVPKADEGGGGGKELDDDPENFKGVSNSFLGRLPAAKL